MASKFLSFILSSRRVARGRFPSSVRCDAAFAECHGRGLRLNGADPLQRFHVEARSGGGVRGRKARSGGSPSPKR